MPMPTPSSGESVQDFIARFMSDETMKADFPDTEQRVAVAYKQFRRKRVDARTDPFVEVKTLAVCWQGRYDLLVGMGRRWEGHITEAPGSGRTEPVRVKKVGEAVRRILGGEIVEIEKVRKV